MSRGEQGFSLIEVLVALAILALVSAAVFSALWGGMERSEAGARALTAQQVARSKLDEWEAGALGNSGHAEGRLSGGYDWTVDADPYAPGGAELIETDQPGPMQVTVTIGWREGETQRSLSFKTVRVARIE